MSEVEAIQAAFGYDTALCDRILAAAKKSRDQMQLFVDIARYTSQHMYQNGPEPALSKKRKLEESSQPVEQNSVMPFTLSGSLTSAYAAPDTSFAVPQRKKMSVELLVDGTNTGNGLIGVTHEASGINYAIPFAEIDQAFCLPVPEKAQRQWNFVIFSKRALDRRTGAQVPEAEQLVWTMNETAPSNISVAPGFEPVECDTYVTSCLRSMNACLAPLGKSAVIPSETEFASAIPQSHRKGEPAYHVKAHRGSKDGYLFFVASGIVWAFKKPLALFGFDVIESISYTSVLQRTFNLVVTTMADPATGKREETEFSMIDQQDFAGIDEYIKRHNLNDASMAAERRAKKLNVNGKPKVEDGGDARGEDGAEEEEETELQKAERELEDEEDEDEEDYDPGSEGESEGSGTSDEEDEGDDGDEDGESGQDDDEEMEEDEGLEGEGPGDEE